MLIKIDIKEKRAQALGSPVLVCGNTDNVVEFTFDEEWAEEPVKTARFVYIQDGAVKYSDVVFNGNRAAVPLLSNTKEVKVGVFSGELITTTPAVIPCELSILCGTGTPEAPTPSQYDQIVTLLNSNQTLVNDVANQQDIDRANNMAMAQDLQQQFQTADQNLSKSITELENRQDKDRADAMTMGQDLLQQFQTADQNLSKSIKQNETDIAALQEALDDVQNQTDPKTHDHDDRYNTKAEITSMVLDTVAGLHDMIETKSDKEHTHDDSYSKKDHTHDDRYNTKAEITSMVLDTVAGLHDMIETKSDKEHTHDGRYYTEEEVDDLISQALYNAQLLVTDLASQTDSKLAGKSGTGHQHWFLEPQGGGNTVLVTSGGNLYPMIHEGQQLGTTTNRWSYILGKYIVGSAEVNGPVVNATTQVNSPKFNNTSDERVKENFDTDMAKYVAMLDLLEPTSYHFKSEADMEDRKRNVGYIAQRVQDAMAEVGLDDTDFGGLCYDPERESQGEFSYGLAYSQFIPILHAKLKQLEEKYDAKIAEYDKRIAELEALLNVKE